MEKRKLSILGLLPTGLLALQLLLPLCKVIAFFAGMEFTIYNVEIYSIVSTTLMLIGVTILFIREIRQDWMYLLICGTALVNGYLWLTGESILAVYLALLNVLAACALLLRRGQKWKYVVAVPCGLLAILFIVIGSGRCFFHGWVENTIVQQIPSPDGHYTAQVISEQSLMDSDTLVAIQDCRRRADVLFGKFETPAKRIYEIEWGPAETMTVQWHDEDTLLINGEYYILEDPA